MASLIVAIEMLQLEEIAEEILSRRGQDRFRMELDALDPERGMTHTHNFAFGRFGGYFKAGRKAGAFHDQRMIAGGVEGIWQLAKDRASIVLNAGCLAVHEAFGSHHPAAERHRQRLVPQANAENGQPSGEVLNRLD
jgi:hypothetical protein